MQQSREGSSSRYTPYVCYAVLARRHCDATYMTRVGAVLDSTGACFWCAALTAVHPLLAQCTLFSRCYGASLSAHACCSARLQRLPTASERRRQAATLFEAHQDTAAHGRGKRNNWCRCSGSTGADAAEVALRAQAQGRLRAARWQHTRTTQAQGRAAPAAPLLGHSRARHP